MTDLREGWEVASAIPDAYGPDGLDALEWRPASVPGTAASVVGVDGRDFDAEDWFFRVEFTDSQVPVGARRMLELGGIATVSEVYLNGRLVLESSSMWARHLIDVTDHLAERNVLLIVCRALAPLLSKSRRPRQRWRTRLVHDGNLRWFRTMILGRSPGCAPGPAAVGPWRPVRLLDVAADGLDDVSIRTRLDDDAGILTVRATPRGAPGTALVVLDGQRVPMVASETGNTVEAEVRIEQVRRWWPHTHGEPELYDVGVEVGGEPVISRRVGFRSLSWAQDIVEDGLDLHVNGVPVFARGAAWTPADLTSLAPSDELLERALVRARDAGINMLRVVATGAYESERFHDLCDELGILVWQDLMFASLDYPISDPEFRAQCEHEVVQLLGEVGGRPSLAILCGNHELEQQPAMLGLDPSVGRDSFWEEIVPSLLARAGVDCVYVRSTPCGGELPFQPGKGIDHYFAVGGYFRSPSEVRRDAVKFAAECLPFANVPEAADPTGSSLAGKAGVQRDAGPALQPESGFDFADVRDFYLEWLFGVDPVRLRRADQDRYRDLSRVASGEMIAEVMGEWRREGSPCRGALMLWLKDVVPGAGFGVLDYAGEPKAAYHYLRRALAPVAVWTTDEGLAGVAIHLANDRLEPLRARLRVALYQGMEVRIDEAEEIVSIPAHGGLERSVEGMLGRFVDSALAYGFGPPAHDLIVVSLASTERPGELISQAVRFPNGRPLERASAAQLGVETQAAIDRDEGLLLTIRARHLLYGVRLDVPGFQADDDVFSIEPDAPRTLRMRRVRPDIDLAGGTLTALNLNGAVSISPAASQSGYALMASAAD